MSNTLQGYFYEPRFCTSVNYLYLYLFVKFSFFLLNSKTQNDFYLVLNLLLFLVSFDVS